ncbi:protein kinase [Streptomyces sp. NPDC059447]|uniref:serine/threonine protein kinase n=1 Tax=Streptomyces sp. NPDC059447 TaxID=3346834 RepID=UPI00369129B8
MRGETVAQRYRLEKRLGSGGAGDVWRAEDQLLHRTVAVKLVQPAPGQTDLDSAVRFAHEVRAVGSLVHPHIVTAHDRGAEVVAGRLFHYLVMEYLEGRTLAEVFEGPRRTGWQELAAWSRRIAEVLAAAHRRGIVHRDVKPHNVMLTDEGVIKVLDFGIVKLLGATSRDPNAGLTGGHVIGTGHYMSPEQCSGAPDIDHRTDLYSLGCLMYEGLAAVRPVTASTREGLIHQHINGVVRPLAEVAEGVPPRVADLVMRLLAKNPAERPPDADAVARELWAALRAEGRRRQAAVQRVRTVRAARLQAQARDRAEAVLRDAETRAARLRHDAARINAAAEEVYREVRSAREAARDRLREAEALRESSRAETVRVSRELEWCLRERRAQEERDRVHRQARAEQRLALTREWEEERRAEAARLLAVAAARARRSLNAAHRSAEKVIKEARAGAARIKEEADREQAGIAADRADLVNRLDALRERLLESAGPAQGTPAPAAPPGRIPEQARESAPAPSGRSRRRRSRADDGSRPAAAPTRVEPPGIPPADEVMARLRARLREGGRRA